MAGLERPVSELELADLELVDPTPDEAVTILAGQARFDEIGCKSCHVPNMGIGDPVFREPVRDRIF